MSTRAYLERLESSIKAARVSNSTDTIKYNYVGMVAQSKDEESNYYMLGTNDKVTSSGTSALPRDNVSHMIQTREAAKETFRELNQDFEKKATEGRFGGSEGF